MPKNEKNPAQIDWRLTTWKGSRREQLRRWAQLTLDEILLAQEEMAELSEWLTHRPGADVGDASKS